MVRTPFVGPGTTVQAAREFAVATRGVRGQRENREGPMLGAPDLFQQGEPVLAGKLDVQQHDDRPLAW